MQRQKCPKLHKNTLKHTNAQLFLHFFFCFQHETGKTYRTSGVRDVGLATLKGAIEDDDPPALRFRLRLASVSA
jgi:hypothetical protein